MGDVQIARVISRRPASAMTVPKSWIMASLLAGQNSREEKNP